MNMRGGTSFPGGEVNSDLKGNYENKPNFSPCSFWRFRGIRRNDIRPRHAAGGKSDHFKDAAAKAIYGSKAANGVVVIETKRLDATCRASAIQAVWTWICRTCRVMTCVTLLEKLMWNLRKVYDVNDPKRYGEILCPPQKVLEGQDTYRLPNRYNWLRSQAFPYDWVGERRTANQSELFLFKQRWYHEEIRRENLSGTFNLQYNYKTNWDSKTMPLLHKTSRRTPPTAVSALTPYWILTRACTTKTGYLPFRSETVPILSAMENGTSLTSSYRQFIQQYLFGMDHYRRVKVARKNWALP